MRNTAGRLLTVFAGFAGIGLLAAAGSAAFAQSGGTSWPTLDPTQTLEPTSEEMYPGPAGSPPATLYFGAALAAQNGTALIGMPGYPGEQNGGASDQGAVAIFVQHAGSWERAGTLRPTDPAASEYFGEGVALSGGLAAVQSESGIYLFERTAKGWRQIQKLTPPPHVKLDGGLAIGDRTLFAGAPAYGQPGAVFIYEPDLTGVWRRVQTLVSGEGVDSDYFGGDIALSGATLIVGAAGDDGGQGAAFVFTRGLLGWSAPQKLIPADVQAGEAFGSAVAIANGRIAVSAPSADTEPSGECFAGPSGAVYVFKSLGGLWRQQSKIAKPAAQCDSSFGDDVAIASNRVIGAAPSVFPYQQGASYVFQRDGQAYLPSGEAPDSSLVSTPVLAASGDVLFTGLPYDRGFSTGIVETFTLGGASAGDEASDE